MDRADLKLVDLSARFDPGKHQGVFPFGLGEAGVHEVCPAAYGDATPAAGFALAAGVSGKAAGGALVWVSCQGAAREHGQLSARGLLSLGVSPARLLEIRVRKPANALWALEEAMTCPAVGCVLAELGGADFTATRRLALASERHGTPAILLLPHGREGATAATARWRLQPRASAPNRHNPRGLGKPRWRAVLERSRIAPAAAGSAFDLEFDHETVCLHLVSRLATRQAAAQPEARPADTGRGPPLRRAG